MRLARIRIHRGSEDGGNDAVQGCGEGEDEEREGGEEGEWKEGERVQGAGERGVVWREEGAPGRAHRRGGRGRCGACTAGDGI